MTMRPNDLGHTLTDKALAKLERRIAEIYKIAADELQETIDSYFESFQKRDEAMKALVGTEQNGRVWTEADYKQWRLNQIARGERYQSLRDRIAKRYTDANGVAISYINDATPGIYSLNRNYAAYTIEKVAGDVGFDLWDERTVRRLISSQPDLMPYYPKAAALKRGIDLEYGKKQITASVTSSILQGKSIKGIADDLQRRIPTMSRDSAIRTARTAVTGAQNAGRMDSYVAAKKMGIDLKREWMATLDNRTRHAHAMLDGQVADIDKPFKIDGYEIMFPGDKSAPGYLVYNCRCTLVADIAGIDTSGGKRSARDPATGKSVQINDMTYQEWAGWKEKATRVDKIEKFVPAGTIEDARKYAKDRLGLDQATAYSLGINLDVANGVNEAIYRINGVFDGLIKSGYLENVLLSTSKTTSYAMYSPSLSSVFLNPVVKRANAIQKMAKDAAEEFAAGAWSTNSPFHSVYHEIGHAVQHMLLDKNAILKNKINILYSETFSAIMGSDAWSVSSKDIIAKGCTGAKNIGFSYYGLRNSGEFVAESIAQYFLSENPSEISKRVVEILKGG